MSGSSGRGSREPAARTDTVTAPRLARPFRVIGTRVAKLDAVEKVTGAVQYLPDLEVPDMVWGKILRTRVPHARVVRIDTTRAETLPGVLGARMMGAGFGGCTINLVEADHLEAFRAGMLPAYRDGLGKEPAIHVCRPSA